MSKEIKEINRDVLRAENLMHVWKQIGEENFPTLSFALYRRPGNEMNYELAGSFHPLIQPDQIDLNALPAGFIVAPFTGKPWYLPADISWSKKDGILKFNNDLQLEKGQGNKKFNSDSLKKLFKTSQDDILLSQESNQYYLDLVKSSVKAIQSGEAKKIVPANRKTLVKDLIPSLFHYFDELCSRYPNAFVSLISSHETGTWMGASPEILVSSSENQFQTASVAGTQPYEGQILSQVAWTQKEIEEQALVSRYIIDCFKKIRLREFEEHGPKTVIAGNLLHLKTLFTVDTKATNFPELGSVMLELLHPTSAVCGMPLDMARDFLLENEKFDRKFFSGFIGPVGQNHTELFVNIRCMEVHPNSATLYAGAGVTIDSIPEKELAETHYKFATMEKIIHNNEPSANN